MKDYNNYLIPMSFYNTNIQCIHCGCGPTIFSVYNKTNGDIVPKYGNYCSLGCIMSQSYVNKQNYYKKQIG